MVMMSLVHEHGRAGSGAGPVKRARLGNSQPITPLFTGALANHACLHPHVPTLTCAYTHICLHSYLPTSLPPFLFPPPTSPEESGGHHAGGTCNLQAVLSRSCSLDGRRCGWRIKWQTKLTKEFFNEARVAVAQAARGRLGDELAQPRPRPGRRAAGLPGAAPGQRRQAARAGAHEPAAA